MKKRILKKQAKLKGISNVLVQYKGGGYDGCHWEWNYFHFDSYGRFMNIASSGHNGIENKSDAMELLKEKNNDHPYYRNAYYLYSLSSQSDIDDFCNESSEQHVIGVGIKLNTIFNKDLIYWTCSDCDEKMFPYSDDPYDGNVCGWKGYHGIGGIAIQNDGPVCVDCFCSNSCCECGEYVGSPEDSDSNWFDLVSYCENNEIELTENLKKEFDEADQNYGPFCEWCGEKKLNEVMKKAA